MGKTFNNLKINNTKQFIHPRYTIPAFLEYNFNNPINSGGKYEGAASCIRKIAANR